MAPYFDQSGISIILRKPVRARSLFKFMEVYAMRWFWITDVSLIFLKFVKIIQLLNKFIKFLWSESMIYNERCFSDLGLIINAIIKEVKRLINWTYILTPWWKMWSLQLKVLQFLLFEDKSLWHRLWEQELFFEKVRIKLK